MPERDFLSVRELVHDAGFDLHLLTGEVGLDRAVHGIHLSDYEDPTPWMASESVLITTGASFAGSSQAAVAFLDRIAEKDTVALGVGVGKRSNLEHVAPEMVARAKELRLPIFEIPETVPFRAMFAYVYNALASSDMHHLRRAVSVQAQLLDLLLEENGIGEVLSRLASILAMSVLLFDSNGVLVAQSGASDLSKAELERIWRTYAAVDDLGPLNVLEAEHGRFLLREIRVHGSLERVLAAVANKPPTSEFAEIALSFAQRLIHLDLLRESEQLALRRRMRALLLDDLVSRSDVDQELRQRLLDQNVDLRQPWRVIVCGDVDLPGGDAGEAVEKEHYEFRARICTVAEDFLRKHRRQVISMVKSDQIVLLAVFGDLDRAAAHTLLVDLRRKLEAEAGSSALRIGASSPSQGDLSPAAALRQAAEAARAAAEGAGVIDGVVLFEEVGGRFRLLTGQSDEALAAIVTRLIMPLVEHDRLHHTHLLPTLRAFFDSRLSAHDTADVLFIHRNTLHKRLHRIEELLQVDLGRMDDVLELYVGLRAAEMLDRETLR